MISQDTDNVSYMQPLNFKVRLLSKRPAGKSTLASQLLHVARTHKSSDRSLLPHQFLLPVPCFIFPSDTFFTWDTVFDEARRRPMGLEISYYIAYPIYTAIFEHRRVAREGRYHHQSATASWRHCLELRHCAKNPPTNNNTYSQPGRYQMNTRRLQKCLISDGREGKRSEKKLQCQDKDGDAMQLRGTRKLRWKEDLSWILGYYSLQYPWLWVRRTCASEVQQRRHT